jgi:membrane-associated protease RseP (regulator of RpoE activity)
MPEPSDHEAQPIPAEVIEIIPAEDWRFRDYSSLDTLTPVGSPPPPRRRIVLPVFLFVATCLSTFGVRFLPYATAGEIQLGLVHALQYSGCLMTILLCHEMGHFLQSVRYKIRASLPFFIPLPVPQSFGTMGAVIVMQSRLGSRKTLFDVGITGPLAGLVPTIICCVLGIQWSTFEPAPREIIPGSVFNAPPVFEWLCSWLGKTAPPDQILALHPVAFAGWVGLLIPSLNLIPIGQLDGGHVLYALLRRKSYLVVRLLITAAFFCIVFYFRYFSQWAILLFLLILMGIFHPPTANDNEDLGWFRTVLGILTLLFIPFGFTPVPMVW